MNPTMATMSSGQIEYTGLPPVRQLERNDVARLQADAHEMAGQTLCVLVERDATQLSLAIENVNFLRMCSDTLAREIGNGAIRPVAIGHGTRGHFRMPAPQPAADIAALFDDADRKSTRLNSSH